MKKAFYILFCFYFISLAVMPCGDKDDCNELKHEQTSQNSGDHQDEVCTPFCVCSCCATHFVVKPFQSIQTQIAVINTVYTVHPESETSTAVIPVWQPPKLA
ncbi:MAG TPA: hypothetical protein PKZ75_14680 [Bacteroidia bacterium]|nr:hypothetical protein [Bacteroidia bacterium]